MLTIDFAATLDTCWRWGELCCSRWIWRCVAGWWWSESLGCCAVRVCAPHSEPGCRVSGPSPRVRVRVASCPLPGTVWVAPDCWRPAKPCFWSSAPRTGASPPTLAVSASVPQSAVAYGPSSVPTLSSAAVPRISGPSTWRTGSTVGAPVLNGSISFLFLSLFEFYYILR